MEALFKVLLTIHILAGFTALVIGIVPMISKKGGRLHKSSGLIYFWAMLLVFLTSQPMAFIKGNFFLFTIGIFSFYFVLTGYRFALKKGWEHLTNFDKRVMQITLVTSILMLLYAAYLLLFSSSLAWIILGIFGGICFYTSFIDLKKFGEKSHPRAWFFEHINRMLGGYIATFTAFAVTNITFVHPMLTWLLPTLIGTIGITMTARHYRRKFKIKVAEWKD